MPALVFNSCCGCLELKSGCFIIGYMNLVVTIIFTIINMLLVVGGGVMGANSDESVKTLGVALLILSSFDLILAIILLAFVITLLIGLHQNKAGHVKAYLIVSMICNVIFVIVFIARLCRGSLKTGYVLLDLSLIIVETYFALVIRSQYHHMKNSSIPPVYTA